MRRPVRSPTFVICQLIPGYRMIIGLVQALHAFLSLIIFTSLVHQKISAYASVYVLAGTISKLYHFAEFLQSFFTPQSFSTCIQYVIYDLRVA